MLAEFNKVLDNEIRKKNEIPPAWYTNLGEDKTMPLEKEIIHSEVLEGYRNKVEFTVGRAYAPPRPGHDEFWNPEAPICVGFNRSNLRKGINFVESPECIRVNSSESLLVAKQFEEIVRNAPSELTVFDKATAKGFWRILLYRESKVTKQVLICVVVSKSTESNPVPEVSDELKN